MDPTLDLRPLDATAAASKLAVAFAAESHLHADVCGIVGGLAGGVAALVADGEAVVATPMADPACVDAARVVDVRQRSEYVAGHVPGALDVEFGAAGTATVSDGLLGTVCGHRERAASAAKVLERYVRTDVWILSCVPDDWARASGGVLEAAA